MANWEATVAALQPLLPGGRPKLTQELLQRPPFRFIHDIVAALQAATGFPAAGLFGDVERDARAMDKEAKLAYIDKLQGAICGALGGPPPPARASKVVAGLEPEATNAMLQLLAAATQRHAAGGTSSGGARSAAQSGNVQASEGQQHSVSTRSSAALPALPPEDDGGLDHGAEGSTPVVFARLDNLLPALARKMGEARAALQGAAPPAGSQEALDCCATVAAIAYDAAALAQSLEALQAGARAMAAEGAAWAREAGRTAAQLEREQAAEAAAAAASQRRLEALDAQLVAARGRR